MKLLLYTDREQRTRRNSGFNRFSIIMLLVVLLLSSALGTHGALQAEEKLYTLFAGTYEEKMVNQASRGDLTDYTLSEAAIIASGAENNTKLEEMTQKLQTLVTRHVLAIRALDKSRYQSARLILSRLHDNMLGHYQTERTTMLDVLREKTYNCVSSAFLYNIVAEEMGYLTRGMVVPGHVFSQIKLNNRWIDIETTSANGFHPYRKRKAGQKQGARYFIEDKGKNERHIPIATSQLSALIYYNRGTLAVNKNHFKTAVSSFRKALLILPNHKESRENLLSTYIKWAQTLLKRNSGQKALAVCDDAARVLGSSDDVQKLFMSVYTQLASFRAQQNRHREGIRLLKKLEKMAPAQKAKIQKQQQSYYAQWAQYLLKNNKYSSMMAVINEAIARWDSHFLHSFRIHLTTQAALRIFQQKSYKKGIDFYKKHIPRTNENKEARSNRQYLLQKWGKHLLQSKNYKKAYEVYEQGLEVYPNTKLFRQNREHTVHTWIKHLVRNHPPRESLPQIRKLYQELNNPMFLKTWVTISLSRANDHISKQEFQNAEHILDHTAESGLLSKKQNSVLHDLRRKLYFTWGLKHANRNEFEDAIEIYQRGLKILDGDPDLNKNLQVFYYNYALSLFNSKQYNRARTIVEKGLKRFPDNKGLLKLASYLDD